MSGLVSGRFEQHPVSGPKVVRARTSRFVPIAPFGLARALLDDLLGELRRLNSIGISAKVSRDGRRERSAAVRRALTALYDDHIGCC